MDNTDSPSSEETTPSAHPLSESAIYTSLLSAITIAQSRLALAKTMVENEIQHADTHASRDLCETLRRPDLLAATMGFKRVVMTGMGSTTGGMGRGMATTMGGMAGLPLTAATATGSAIRYIPLDEVEFRIEANMEIMVNRNIRLSAQVEHLREEVEYLKEEIGWLTERVDVLNEEFQGLMEEHQACAERYEPLMDSMAGGLRGLNKDADGETDGGEEGPVSKKGTT